MLRIHFGNTDLLCTRLASRPDPLWAIACSLHRSQTDRAGGCTPTGSARRVRRSPARPSARPGRADAAHRRVPTHGLLPRLLDPPEAAEGMSEAMKAVIDTPPERVRDEIARLDRTKGAPPWAHRFTDKEDREQLLAVLAGLPRGRYRSLRRPGSRSWPRAPPQGRTPPTGPVGSSSSSSARTARRGPRPSRSSTPRPSARCGRPSATTGPCTRSSSVGTITNTRPCRYRSSAAAAAV